MSVEIVSVGVKVPNPSCGFGTLRESSVELEIVDLTVQSEEEE